MEHSTAFHPSTCVKKGFCPIKWARKEASQPSHSLYYEQHGCGTKYKVLFIAGLSLTSFLWGPQVAHFGPSAEHSMVIFDNRGVGLSGYPWERYTTSRMAEDILHLLDFLSWTEEHDLHVVGISLGGMIAQELATRIPNRIASLVLVVTTPGGRPWNNLAPLSGMLSLVRYGLALDLSQQADMMMKMLHPSSWLNLKAEDDSAGRTNHQVEKEALIRIATITRPQHHFGALSQMTAALTHHCSPDRLRMLSSSIPKIVILTGDIDILVHPSHSLELKASMPKAEYIQWTETGHGIPIQRAKMFNELLERTFKEGRKRSQRH